MEFAKLHGTGNDFVVIDAPSRGGAYADRARAICDRHFGVGADGLIVAEPSPVAAVRMRIFNADGSEAEMSGNGMRCLVKYVVDRGLVRPAGDAFDVETGAGVLGVRVERDAGGRVTRVRQDMGMPRLAPEEIPLALEAIAAGGSGERAITCAHAIDVAVDGARLAVTPVSMGNPHAVLFQEAPVEAYPLERLGPLVEHHPLFPKRTNFEVVRMLGRDRAEMRVWERGVGETLSCGSGASAVMVAARLNDLADGALRLRVPGGELDLEWDGAGAVVLTGPVVEVFRGVWPD